MRFNGLNVTDKELDALRGIVESEYGEHPMDATWSEAVGGTQFTAKQFPGVASSLNKKGWAVSGNDFGADNTIHLTAAGVQVLMALAGYEYPDWAIGYDHGHALSDEDERNAPDVPMEQEQVSVTLQGVTKSVTYQREQGSTFKWFPAPGAPLAIVTTRTGKKEYTAALPALHELRALRLSYQYMSGHGSRFYTRWEA